MAKQAVGLLETRGLACLVVGVDAAVKAASDAGAAIAASIGEVVSAHVIARPDDAIEGVLPKEVARTPRK